MIARLTTILLGLSLLALPVSAQGGASPQIGTFVVDDRIGAAVCAEWTVPVGNLAPERPGPGPRRVQARPWSVVLSASAGPSLGFDAGNSGTHNGGADVGFTLFGTTAVQRKLNGSMRAGLGLVGILGDGHGLGAYLRGDYEGVVVVNAGWIDRSGRRDTGPYLAVVLDWALLRDSGA